MASIGSKRNDHSRDWTWVDDSGQRHFALEVWVLGFYVLLFIGAIGLAIALAG